MILVHFELIPHICNFALIFLATVNKSSTFTKDILFLEKENLSCGVDMEKTKLNADPVGKVKRRKTRAERNKTRSANNKPQKVCSLLNVESS